MRLLSKWGDVETRVGGEVEEGEGPWSLRTLTSFWYGNLRSSGCCEYAEILKKGRGSTTDP